MNKLFMNLSFKLNESNSMMNMNKLNDKLMMMMIMLLMMVTMMIMMKNKLLNKSTFENQKMETMWTTFPSLIIILMTYLSIPILYMNNELKMNVMSMKVSGNQWFWNYNYMNFKYSFNSYMMLKKKFNFNLIETDNSVILPLNNEVLFILSASDVIHSWTMPSMNFKCDVIPGQINTVSIKSNKIGISFGQCSEVCGINHSFMPIKVETVTMKEFVNWIKKF
uniref:cytochrome c oxidase subunit II n=1 Tax=Ceroplastes floridensis TaxID=1182648 RepID=UPI002207AA15|nr:cytochrome c oxidase subunit II [Ceroplastes floridensis]UXW93674.1 cytochrome c oxidase subunit II [Ceroplastes floridensis]